MSLLGWVGCETAPLLVGKWLGRQVGQYNKQVKCWRSSYISAVSLICLHLSSLQGQCLCITEAVYSVNARPVGAGKNGWLVFRYVFLGAFFMVFMECWLQMMSPSGNAVYMLQVFSSTLLLLQMTASPQIYLIQWWTQTLTKVLSFDSEIWHFLWQSCDTAYVDAIVDVLFFSCQILY